MMLVGYEGEGLFVFPFEWDKAQSQLLNRRGHPVGYEGANCSQHLRIEPPTR